MPRKIVTLRDKYGSTTRYYPKVLKQCLPEELQDIFPLTKGNFTGKIYFDEWGEYGLAPVLEIKKDATHKAECRVYGNKYNNEDLYGVEMTYQEGSTLVGLTLNKNGVLLSGGLDKDININTYGTGKLYINGEEYQAGGGGSQLYQHNIVITNSTFGYHFTLTITNDSNIAINDVNKLQSYLSSKGFTTTSKMLKVSGAMNADSTLAVASGMYYDGAIRIECVKSNGTTTAVVASNNGSVIKDDNII